MRLPTRIRFAESTKDLTMSRSASERTSGNGGRGPVRTAVALSASVVLSGMLTSAVIAARTRMRRAAEAKERSVTSAKPARVASSAVKACTVCAASSVSDALPDEAAIQSWFSRDSARRRRPPANTAKVPRGLVRGVTSRFCSTPRASMSVRHGARMAVPWRRSDQASRSAS